MPLYQYLRWLCLFILGLNVAAAVIQPSTTVRDLDGRQSDLQLPTPPPLRDSSVESISPVERVQSDAEHIYNENVIIPNVNDADRANMDSRRGHETSETSPPNESVLDVEPDYWPLLRLCAYVALGSCIVKIAREFMR